MLFGLTHAPMCVGHCELSALQGPVKKVVLYPCSTIIFLTFSFHLNLCIYGAPRPR